MADQQVTNPKLIEAIENMRKDFTPDTQNATINGGAMINFRSSHNANPVITAITMIINTHLFISRVTS